MAEHSTELKEDERKCRVAAGMRIANLNGGGRRITHPSGLVCIETKEQRAELRAEIIQDITARKKVLADFDREGA